MGCYLAPDDTSTINSVVAVIKERPKGPKLLVAVDFSANLAEPEGDWRGEDIAAALNGGNRGYIGALPPPTVPVVPGQEDVEYDTRS